MEDKRTGAGAERVWHQGTDINHTGRGDGMNLQTFCFLALAIGLVIIIAGAVIEGEIEYRKRQIKMVRDLKAENARLRAEVRRAEFNGEWKLDSARTELAVKDLLLRQRWASAKK